jgi:UDP-N-acetylglucosamine 2-epimerase (non-hydrolysing)
MRIMCVVGTRPEAIKMAPVIRALAALPGIETRVLSTAQHRHMVEPLLAFFGIRPDHDLDAMTANQSLAELTSRLLTRISALLGETRPDLVVAQGDTTTVMTTALACFYLGIDFAHVEAGLRTGDLGQPFPEELNRIVAGRIAALNFAPTAGARDNLLREGTDAGRIFVTGNTVIDALLWTAERVGAPPVALAPGQRLLLMTRHRRESFGAPIRAVLGAVRDLLARNPDLVLLYPVHPNPNVAGPAQEILGAVKRAHLVAPLDYPDLIAAMRACHLVLTDSGGIQEEAPALGKPVLVTRETTERPEAVDEGVAALVGTDPGRITRQVQRLLDDPAAYAAMAKGASPYGDGRAAARIAEIVTTAVAGRVALAS